MKLVLQEPLTAEQAKLVAECERIDIYLGVLGRPLPIGPGEPIIDDLGRGSIIAIEHEEKERLQVLKYALERRLHDLEMAKSS